MSVIEPQERKITYQEAVGETKRRASQIAIATGQTLVLDEVNELLKNVLEEHGIPEQYRPLDC